MGIEYYGGTGKDNRLDGSYDRAVSRRIYRRHTWNDTGCSLNGILPLYLSIWFAEIVRFAENVWGVQTEGKSKEQIAKEGLASMESWMREIGLVMNLRELGVTEEMIEGIAEGTFVMDGGYKILRMKKLSIF